MYVGNKRAYMFMRVHMIKRLGFEDSRYMKNRLVPFI